MKEKDILKAIRKDIRCPYCNKLIMKAKLWGNYDLEFVCPRCKSIIELKKYDKKEKTG